ncbi:MAG: site-2 protease family protein, partial [Xenococcaceae cyanobacterium]
KTGHMTLNPIVHMGWYSVIFMILSGFAWGQMPVNPYKFRHPRLGNIIVSAAGPLTNLLLSLLAILTIGLSLFTGLSGIISIKFFFMAAYLNMGLFLFNMCPIPPLDGFRIVSEVFTDLKAFQNSFVELLIFTIFLTSGISKTIFMFSNYLVDALANYN